MRSGIDGITVHPLAHNRDDRGTLTEFYRTSWTTQNIPLQWNHVTSGANVLRGLHVHTVHTDLLAVVAGSMSLGLVDLRPDSPTFGRRDLLTLSALDTLVEIPTGVGHGFYFSEPSTIVYGVTHYWDRSDELGCRWDDPELAIEWPCTDPVISDRDRSAGTFAALAAQVATSL